MIRKKKKKVCGDIMHTCLFLRRKKTSFNQKHPCLVLQSLVIECFLFPISSHYVTLKKIQMYRHVQSIFFVCFTINHSCTWAVVDMYIKLIYEHSISSLWLYNSVVWIVIFPALSLQKMLIFFFFSFFFYVFFHVLLLQDIVYCT